MGSIFLPSVLAEQGMKLRADESHFRMKLHSLFTNEFKLSCKVRVKKNNCLPEHHSVLRAAEGQDIHPSVAGKRSKIFI